MTENSSHQITAAVYETDEDAVAAISEFQRSGFDMRNLSIVGRGCHNSGQSVGYYNAGDRMKYWGNEGAFWDDLWGMLYGSAFFLVPGFGPVLVGGPVFASILGALEGGPSGGGVNSLAQGILSMGIPGESIPQYENAVRGGGFLVLAETYPGDSCVAPEHTTTTPLASLRNEYELPLAFSFGARKSEWGATTPGVAATL